MPTQLEHLAQLGDSFNALHKQLEGQEGLDPAVKTHLQNLANSINGLDLRLVNDEMKNRIIEAKDGTTLALMRRARGGVGVLSNKASQNIPDVQRWITKLFENIIENHEKKDPPESVMDQGGISVHILMLYTFASMLAAKCGISAAHRATITQGELLVPNIMSDSEFFGIIALHLAALASDKNISLEDAIFEAQAGYEQGVRSGEIDKMLSEVAPLTD